MSKPFRAMVWTTARLEKLKQSTEEAVRLGMAGFTVDFDREHKNVVLTTEDAVRLVHDLSADMAQHPMPKFPENREGQEP